MSNIINKLLGRDDEVEHSRKNGTKSGSVTLSTSITGGEKCGNKQECKSGTCQTCGPTSESRTVQRDGVNIKSTISTSEGNSSVSFINQQKLNDLVTKLGSTHALIDEYSRNQAEKVNEEIQREIDAVVGRTRREQDELLRKANERTRDIDSEYHARLQLMVEEIDANKAKRIAEIEKELNEQQNGILLSARNEIDELNKRAAKLKIGILESAQAKAAYDANQITAEAARLGQTSTVHQSSGITTIKTEVSAATTTTGKATEIHGAPVTAAKVSETKTIETRTQESRDVKL